MSDFEQDKTKQFKYYRDTHLWPLADDFNFEENFDTSYKKENPVEHALMVKASEADDNRLVG